MGCKQVHLLLCVVYCFSLTMSMESSLQFVNVDSIEGPILFETEMDTVKDCVTLCARYSPTCGGTMYLAVSKTCVIMNKWAIEEINIYRADSHWTIFKKVGVGILARRLTSLRTFMY